MGTNTNTVFRARARAGSIEAHELQDALHAAGVRLGPPAVMAMMQLVDDQGDFRVRPAAWMRLFDDVELRRSSGAVSGEPDQG